MRHLLELLGRLRRDEGGAFAVIFAVLAIVLVAMSGAVVDFTSMQQARTRAQVALDAAALSLQPDIYGTSASTLQTEAQKLLTDQLIQPNFAWNDCSSKTKSAPPCATVGLPVVDQTNGTLSLSATLKVPMNFVSMVGVTTLTASIVSVATRQKLNLEVAFVLDNSLSMAEESRMTDLKQATTCAVNILLDNNCNSTATATTVQNTSIAVVPFTNEVNVGTGNVGATWLDMAGAGTLSKTNFAKDDAGTPYGSTNHPLVNANGYFNGLSQSATAAKWGGCVVARVEPYDTDDTPPDPSSPDTLFTPYFAVDEPDSGGFSNTYMSDTPSQCNRTDGTCTTSKVASSSYNSVTQITTTTYTTTIKNNRGQTTAGPTTSVVTQTTGPSTANQSSSTTTGSVLTAANGDRNSSSGICSCNSGHTQSTNTTPGQVNKNTVNGTLPKDTSSTDRNGNVTTVHYVSVRVETDTQPVTAATTDTYTCTGVTYTPWKQGTANTTGGLTPRQMQERQCKYNGATPSGVSQSGDKGPNGDCPTNPIQSLTATKSLITTAIGKLNPQGWTNIHAGVEWGFHVLSPGAPFTDGRPYDQATSKVIIMMTDGENRADQTNNMNGSGIYTYYQYPYNQEMGSLSSSNDDLLTEMNRRTVATCNSAKAVGITVYTIGLDVGDTSDPTANQQMLNDCATPPANGRTYAYFPTDPSQLTAVFTQIANDLAALRLSK